MILKAEQGNFEDNAFSYNSKLLHQYKVPYGAYDYSVYQDPTQARDEAYNLYFRAPHAKFYINDSEENDAGYSLNESTKAWADEMHQLTDKPVVLYSDLSFMNNLSRSARDAYDALWVAAYGSEPDPAWHYDLWQYTDSHYSPAMHQSVDASIVPYGGRPISFWIGKHSKHKHQIIMPKSTINKQNDSVRKHVRTIHIHIHKVHRHKTVSSSYYHSSNVRHLIVVHHSGISLYDISGNYLRHIKYGTILHVRYFKKFPYTKHHYMTRAVDYWHHRWVMYTARKSKLHPYYF